MAALAQALKITDVRLPDGTVPTVPGKPEKNPDFPNLNVGGNFSPGRPPSELRSRMAALAYDEVVPLVERMIRDGELKHGDTLRALDILAKYGIGQRVEYALTDDQLLSVAQEVVTSMFGSERIEEFTERVLARLKEAA